MVSGDKSANINIPEIFIYKSNINDIIAKSIAGGGLDKKYTLPESTWEIYEIEDMKAQMPSTGSEDISDYFNFFNNHDEYYIIRPPNFSNEIIVSGFLKDLDEYEWDISRIKNIIQKYSSAEVPVFINDVMFIVSNGGSETFITGVLGVTRYRDNNNIEIHISKGFLDLKTFIHELIHADIKNNNLDMGMDILDFVWKDKYNSAINIKKIIDSSSLEFHTNKWWDSLHEGDIKSHYGFKEGLGPNGPIDSSNINKYLEEFLIRVIIRSLDLGKSPSIEDVFSEVGYFEPTNAQKEVYFKIKEIIRKNF